MLLSGPLLKGSYGGAGIVAGAAASVTNDRVRKKSTLPDTRSDVMWRTTTQNRA